jgi:hypothetical protein
MGHLISVRSTVNYLINCLFNRVMCLIIMIPVVLVSMRVCVFMMLDMCGLPVKASYAVSDMVLFFVVALFVFTLIDRCIPIPDVLKNFDALVEQARYAGLY